MPHLFKSIEKSRFSRFIRHIGARGRCGGVGAVSDSSFSESCSQAGEKRRFSPACVRHRDVPASIMHVRARWMEQARDRVLRAAR